MAAITFATLKNHLQRAIDLRWPSPTRRVTPADISTWVISAHKELDRKLRWTRSTEEITVSADDNEYSVSSSSREWLAIEFEDEDGHIWKLVELFLEEFIDLRQQSIDLTQRPAYYMRHGDTIYLYPTPGTDNEIIRIWTVDEPADLSADDSAPVVPEHLHQLIEDIGIAYARRHY